MSTETKPALFYSFCVLLAFAYIWGVVSIQHYLPSYGLYIGLFVALILGVALLLFFVTWRVGRLSYGVLLWFGLFVLVAVQPLLHQTVYPDRLIFPSVGLFLVMLLALAVAQLSDDQKRQAVHIMSFAIGVGGVLTVASQLVQLFNFKPLMGVLVFSPSGSRLVGNVAQVNQAAFVSCLAMSAVVYFVHYYRVSSKLLWLLLAVLMTWLGMGLGFSASRAGLILALMALSSSLIFYQATYRQRLAPTLLFLPCVVLGYQLGTWLMNTYLQVETSALGRMVGENSLHLRTSLLHQAKLAFLQNPILGNGFNTMNHFGLQHFDELTWFTAADHTHNVIGQFAAELGVVGLLFLCGFVLILLKNLRFSLPPYLAFAYGMLAIIGLYSLSEYPLWYLKFLFLAVFLLAIVDSSKLSISIPKAVLVMLSACLVLGSVFYIKQYQHYQSVAYMVKNSKIPQDKKVAAYHKLPDVFGYTKYKELAWFLIMPIATKTPKLQEQAELGDRVLTQFLSASMLLKQAQILVNLDQADKADRLYEATCVFGSSTFCHLAIDHLYKNCLSDPQRYQPYLYRFAQWHQTKFAKPIPTMTKEQEKFAKNQQKLPQNALCHVQSTQKLQ